MPECKWLEAGHEIEEEPVNWVIAWMCDRCALEDIIDLCQEHYEATFIDSEGTPQKFGCPDCHGTVSYVARRLDNYIENEMINWGTGE